MPPAYFAVFFVNACILTIPLFWLFINRRVETVTLHFYFRTIGSERAVSSPAKVNQRKKQ
jgi:hypothetical protein